MNEQDIKNKNIEFINEILKYNNSNWEFKGIIYENTKLRTAIIIKLYGYTEGWQTYYLYVKDNIRLININDLTDYLKTYQHTYPWVYRLYEELENYKDNYLKDKLISELKINQIKTKRTKI